MMSPRGSLRPDSRIVRRYVAMPPPADDPRQQGHEDHQQDHGLDVLVDSGNVAAQEIADEQHAPDPEHAADNVVLHVAAVLPFPNSSYEPDKSADDGHKSRKDDGAAAVLLVKRVSAVEMLLVEQQRIFASEQPRPGRRTDSVPGRVADDRRYREEEAEPVHVDDAFRGGEQAGGDDERI